MKYIHSNETLTVPEGDLLPSKDHELNEKGGRGADGGTGKLTKNLNHLAVNFSHPKKDVINIELHHGARKNVATLRTVRTLINNLIIGVTKGFKYKMRYVYAHFPINVNVEKNGETGLFEVEIRYVYTTTQHKTSWRVGSEWALAWAEE
ncbi:60S ribosomal protein [Lachnellula occidentalis]|uniref:60S ribosomal protein n=1 Tax=Lachnellula occidentalis TaxID=215460 RepID=A0A8H8SC72_9HELO|nr:60S ribosomal protein [Lachnellula occidentalis]